jgi:hypothetical protein
VATLNAAEKQVAVREVFAHGETSSLAVARVLGATWLVYGPQEADLKAPPGAAFESGAVRIYRTDRKTGDSIGL